MYASISGMVARFNPRQKQGLREIPLDRLLLETDSPYLPIVGKVNRPHFLGDVASLVAGRRTFSLRQMPTAEACSASREPMLGGNLAWVPAEPKLLCIFLTQGHLCCFPKLGVQIFDDRYAVVPQLEQQRGPIDRGCPTDELVRISPPVWELNYAAESYGSSQSGLFRVIPSTPVSQLRPLEQCSVSLLLSLVTPAPFMTGNSVGLVGQGVSYTHPLPTIRGVPYALPLN